MRIRYRLLVRRAAAAIEKTNPNPWQVYQEDLKDHLIGWIGHVPRIGSFGQFLIDSKMSGAVVEVHLSGGSVVKVTTHARVNCGTIDEEVVEAAEPMPDSEKAILSRLFKNWNDARPAKQIAAKAAARAAERRYGETIRQAADWASGLSVAAMCVVGAVYAAWNADTVTPKRPIASYSGQVSRETNMFVPSANGYDQYVIRPDGQRRLVGTVDRHQVDALTRDQTRQEVGAGARLQGLSSYLNQ